MPGWDFWKYLNDDEDYEPMNTKQLMTARLAMMDPDNPYVQKMSPMRRAFMQQSLKRYQPSDWSGLNGPNGPIDPLSTPGGRFTRNFERYYSPFMQGFDEADVQNIPPMHQKYMNPLTDSREDMYRKYRYNKSMAKLSRPDNLINKMSSGVGGMMMAGGGIPGIALGATVAGGVPLLWDVIKRWRAKSNAKKKKPYQRVFKNIFSRV